MIRRVLLVCTGNICRSPLAAVMLDRALTQRNVRDVEVKSAGTGAWDGAPASEGAYLVALENGLDLSEHRAQLLTRDLAEGSDLILTMARHHRARVDELGGQGRVSVLGEYVGKQGDDAEVSDPFGGDIVIYRDTYTQLEAFIAAAADRLVREREKEEQRGDRR